MNPSKPIRVLHLGTESRWRGGENQIRLLIEGSRDEVEHFVCYPRGSRGLEVFAAMVPTLALHRSTPSSLTDVLRVRQWCRERSIDVVDAHSGNAHTIALLALIAGARSKLVVHRRVARRLRRALHTRWKYRSARVSRFVAISQFIETTLLEYGVPAERVRVVRSAVPMRTVAPDARVRARHALRTFVDLPDEAFVIGNASALTREKGYQVLIGALADLQARAATPFHCVIAGDGPLRRELQQQCRELGLADHVTFLGHVDGVTDLLPAFDVLALPSLREGLGTLLLDATLAGCTLVASDVGGIPEIVRHGETGLLVPPDDPSALAGALAALANDRDQRSRLQQRARSWITQEFSVERMVAGNLSVYRSVLSRSESPSP